MRGNKLYRRLVTKEGTTLYAGTRFTVIADDGEEAVLIAPVDTLADPVVMGQFTVDTQKLRDACL